ncbi:MAG: hypothetical protein QXN61_00225, partial [Zestosphaera sp.]
VVFIKTKLGEIQVSLSDLMNALMSVNASLTQVVITSKGEVLGVISTSKGEILASVNVVKELIEVGLPVDTQTLLNTLTSLINEKSASIMNKLDEILQAVRGVRDTMASKTDVSDLSSKVDTIGQKIDSSSGTLSTYGAVTVGLIIVTLIASIYGFFIKKK